MVDDLCSPLDDRSPCSRIHDCISIQSCNPSAQVVREPMSYGQADPFSPSSLLKKLDSFMGVTTLFVAKRRCDVNSIDNSLPATVVWQRRERNRRIDVHAATLSYRYGKSPGATSARPRKRAVMG